MRLTLRNAVGGFGNEVSISRLGGHCNNLGKDLMTVVTGGMDGKGQMRDTGEVVWQLTAKRRHARLSGPRRGLEGLGASSKGPGIASFERKGN